MNFILRDETNRIIDVFENKNELLGYVREYINYFNADMIEANEKENIINNPINTVGDCIDVLYGFGLHIELK
jgi:hypothetical protein